MNQSGNTHFSRELRRNMTKEERHLWYDFLRSFTPRFHRQYKIGPYIVDFYCHQANLAVELDGSQHFKEKGLAHDAERTLYLEHHGILVIRIPNNAVMENFRGVCEYIAQVVTQRTR